eukprot:TRINITY_DN21_c0_g7_i1.p1 TRINITY_DN21_c0_g7~~TRINITY_DN21_c0_g7_i1.p1  ORF type:complete len:155 (+),score=34.10 TRINITY_DN21_c0_g7_i1:71-535(+)
MKTELCVFSQHKIYPGHGTIFVLKDAKTNHFSSRKARQLFIAKKNPRVIKWTLFYRRQHKKGQAEIKKVRKQKIVIHKQRDYIGASMESIKQRRLQKPEIRKAATQAALREIKKKKEKKKLEKKDAKTKPAGIDPKSSKRVYQKLGKTHGGKGR